MKDTTKKVVILENLSSPYVHQAIIVMRDFNPKLESLAVVEAERIVNAYLDNMKVKNRQPTRAARKRNPLLIILILGCIAAIGAYAIIKLH